jgi:bifunctional N-acetylglucosamine-1-phosphate-uridyltransferase/glucosamine-1-phosphate-acetyltransferase GlmU-like protein
MTNIFISESLKARISKTEIVEQLSDGIKLLNPISTSIAASIMCTSGAVISENVKLVSYTKKKKLSKLTVSLPLKYVFMLTKDVVASVKLMSENNLAHTFLMGDIIKHSIKIENNDRILLKLSFR